MYFRIADEGDGNVYLSKDGNENSTALTYVKMGHEVSDAEMKLPIRFTMAVDDDEEPRLDDWFLGTCLMREELAAALRAAGVANLRTFPAEIKRKDNGGLVPGYVVANLVEPVSCPQAAARGTAPGLEYAFDYELDPARVGDALVFRIAEITQFIIAHERVVDVLRARKVEGIAIVPLAQAPRAAGS